ncbi:MAG: 50S ribosome-binding GTPase [Planctomycetales bacterium]|nr:50S ribosome-binding GTPase [Planctomycetales bacterium]
MNAPANASRAAVLTPAGRGAIAVVAAAGPAALAAADAAFRAANGRTIREQRVGRIVFGCWRSAADASARDASAPSEQLPAEEVVVCRRSEDVVEVHCHGGVAAVERVLAEFAAAGCAIEPWQDWIARDSAGAIETAATAALANASTLRTAAVLLDQQQGALRRALQAALTAAQRGELSLAAEQLDCLARRAALGMHLVAPWRVVIAGRPNVGKSTLLNALLGYERAIVFDQPGTTRDVIAANTAIDGWPVQLRDAAGLRIAGDDVEAAGVQLARQQIAAADLVVWVLDAAGLIDDAAQAIAAAAAEGEELSLHNPSRRPAIVVFNKIDRLDTAPDSADLRGALPVSALRRRGIDELLTAIGQRLVAHPLPAGAGVPFLPEQLTAISAARDAAAAGNNARCCEVLGDLLG